MSTTLVSNFASHSSISSVISAQVSMVWKDFLLHFYVFSKLTPGIAAIITKVLSLLIGTTITGMAVLASHTSSIIQLNIAISGAAFGPVMGLFMLGLFLPRCNTKGAWCGFVSSWIFMCWLAAGGIMYQRKAIPLPVTIENCSTFANITNNVSETLSINEDFGTSFMWLYGISSTLYPAIGSLLCIAVGIVASTLTGSQSILEVSPILVTPSVRKFYWSKQELLDARPKKIIHT